MIRIHSIHIRGLCILFGVLFASAAFGEEATKGTATSPPPPAEQRKGIFDAIKDLFSSESAEEKQPDQAAQIGVAVENPGLIISVEKTDSPPSAQPAAATSDKTASKIQTTYAAALREAQLKNRPILVLLGAEWCSWCRKLEAELETPEAQPILTEWIVAEVDVDKEPEVAARLEASGLPGMRILGPFEKVVASREGYIPVAELKQWLDENRKSADPAMFRVLYDTAEPDSEALTQLAGLLAESSPMIRGAAIERLAANPRVSAGPIVQALKTGRLAQQLAACEVLRRWKAPIDNFDPWQPDTMRAEQLTKLIDWARQRMDTQDSNVDPNAKSTAIPIFDATSANELLQRLMTVDPAQRSSLMAQLVDMGSPLAIEIRSRLARADALDDTSRERLRELLYNLLASRQLRLEQSGVLAALARLELDSHRQASATILDQATVVDQPLLDELARDADPLVRELAVRSFGRLNLMNDKNRVHQLLEDGNSNVRSAVLRVLTEHPSDESVETLCDYLSKETDEDLLVHGAKCLGQLSRQPKAMSALAKLAANPSWRVRATAIETAGTAMQTQPRQPAVSADGDAGGGVPPELVDAIVAAAVEKDAFVAERAGKVLSILMQQGGVNQATLEKIAAGLADHAEQFVAILDRMQEDARSIHHNAGSETVFPPLVRVAKSWLTRGESKDVQRAATLLSRLAPDELDDRIGELIASNDRTVRLAGLRTATHSLEKFRQTSIDGAAYAWALRAEQANAGRGKQPKPWYELPKEEAPRVGETPPAAQSSGTPAPTNSTEQGGIADTAAATLLATAPPAQLAPQLGAAPVATDLFSDPPATSTAPSPAPATQSAAPPANGATAPGAPGNVDERLELPSKWMERSQSGGISNRPKWLAECDASTQKLLSSSDPVEHALALVVWLMLGHSDRVDELNMVLGEKAKNKDIEKELERINVVSWLPAGKREAECMRRISEMGTQQETIVETLRQCTLVDDPAVGEWVFAHLNDAPLADRNLRAALAKVVVRSQLGGFTEERFLGMLRADNYEYSSKPPYRIARTKQTLAIPGWTGACDRLRDNFRNAADDSQRAMALLAVAQLDHKTAVDAAIGAIEAADKQSETLQVAVSIVLNDAPVPSAQRATMLLSHKVPAVRTAALQYLAYPGIAMEGEKRTLAAVVNNQSVLPGLWRATEKIPVEKLHKLTESGSEIQKSQAKLLLAAGGEHIELTQLVHILPAKHTEYAKLCIAAALVKAGRNDHEAVEHYQATYSEAAKESRSHDAQIFAALYEIIRYLPGDDVAELCRRIRNEKGTKLFNNNSDNNSSVGDDSVFIDVSK